jgi:hypothetical protein
MSMRSMVRQLLIMINKELDNNFNTLTKFYRLLQYFLQKFKIRLMMIVRRIDNNKLKIIGCKPKRMQRLLKVLLVI